MSNGLRLVDVLYIMWFAIDFIFQTVWVSHERAAHVSRDFGWKWKRKGAYAISNLVRALPLLSIRLTFPYEVDIKPDIIILSRPACLSLEYHLCFQENLTCSTTGCLVKKLLDPDQVIEELINMSWISILPAQLTVVETWLIRFFVSLP